MMPQREFASLKEVAGIHRSLTAAAESAAATVRSRTASPSALKFLEEVKFRRIGRDPLNADLELNLVEQVNQTFTVLVTIRALEYLFRNHPQAAPFRINPGTASGPDICPVDGTVAAECFAATHPGSNQKLRKDVAKVRDTTAIHRYVFYHCPGDHGPRDVDGVSVIPVDLRGLDSA